MSSERIFGTTINSKIFRLPTTKKRFGFCALFCFLTVVLGSSLVAREREIWERYSIGFLGSGQGSFEYAAASAGAGAAARKLEVEHNLEITLLFNIPREATAEAQAGVLREYFLKNVDGVIMDPNPGQALIDENALLSRQNIPFVYFNRPLPGSQHIYYVGSDEAALGRQAFEVLAEEMQPRGGQVAVLAGNAQSIVTRQRMEGVKSVAEGNESIRPYGIFTCDESLTASVNEIQRVTMGDRDEAINAWLFLGPWPLGGVAALPWESGSMACVAIGADPPQLRYLSDGSVQALVAEDYYQWGYDSVAAIVQKIHLKQEPEAAVRLLPGIVVTRHNLAEYRAKWTGWLK